MLAAEVTMVQCGASRQAAAECLVRVQTAALKHGMSMTWFVAAGQALLHIHSELVNSLCSL